METVDALGWYHPAEEISEVTFPRWLFGSEISGSLSDYARDVAVFLGAELVERPKDEI